MRVLDLFSGIGGFSLGLERAGMRTVAFCEIDPYCRKVLAKHWLGVPIYDDIRTLTAARLAADGIIAGPVANTASDAGQFQQGEREDLRDESAINGAARTIDLICGGFPCQDISSAGKGAGIDGEHSGLWAEMARIVGEVRPRYVIVENVAALLGRGLERVLGDLAALRFDAEWHCIPASAVGAPHRRDRVWIVAHSTDARPSCRGSQSQSEGAFVQPGNGHPKEDVADADARRQLQPQGRLCDIGRWLGDGGWWESEPDVGRVAYGVSKRVDRLRSLGNAVVPQIPELIGRAIMHNEGGSDGDQQSRD